MGQFLDRLRPGPVHLPADKLVRFRTAEEAEGRRAQLIRFIWPDGLPTTRPSSTLLSQTGLSADTDHLADALQRPALAIFALQELVGLRQVRKGHRFGIP